jgi:hypothetical protein
MANPGQSQERTMNQHRNGLMLAVVVVGVMLSAAQNPAFALEPQGKACSNATLRGTYGIQMQGTGPAPGGTQTLIGVVVRHYDGEGGVTQVDNIKGSITGIVPDRAGSGTYQVYENCSVVVDFQPAPGVFIQERMVIVDNGHELRSITVLPAQLMVTSVAIKM